MAVKTVESRVVSVPTAAKLLGISRNYGYEMCRTGQLRCVKLGRRILVPKSAIDELLEAGTVPQKDHAEKA